jgi:hypothetical protein
MRDDKRKDNKRGGEDKKRDDMQSLKGKIYCD